MVALFVAPLAFTRDAFDRWDEIEYISLARAIDSGQLAASPKRPPLLPLLIWGAKHLFSDDAFAARVVVRVLGAGMLLAVLGLAGEVFGATAGLVAFLLAASCPLVLVASSLVHATIPLALFVTLAAWAATRHLGSGSLRALAAANGLAALAALARPEGFALAPLLLALDVRALIRDGARPSQRGWILGGLAALGAAVAWFATHFQYGRMLAESVSAPDRLKHAAWYLGGYLRMLPWLLSWPTFALLVAGLVFALRAWRRGELDRRARAFLGIVAWTVGSVLAGLCAYSYFMTIYLATLIPLLVIVAAFGLESLAGWLERAASVSRRKIVVGGVLLAIAVNLPLASYELAQNRAAARDYFDACRFVGERRGVDARGRPAVVCAVSPEMFEWWTGGAALRYERALLRKARFAVLSDFLAQHVGVDLDREVAFLVDELGGKLVFDETVTLRPFLGMSLCQPYEQVFTPRIVDKRFDLQRFRSVAVELPAGAAAGATKER